MDVVYNPCDSYIYTLNSNDSVSVIDGTDIITTIDLPTGGFSRLTDIEVFCDPDDDINDIYVSQWFFDQVLVIRDLKLYDIILRQNDTISEPMGIENGPTVVAANHVNNLVYVATGWTTKPDNNGVTILSGLEVTAHVTTGAYPQAIAIHPMSGRLYIANAEADTVTILDDTEVYSHIQVDDYPTAIGLDPGRGLIYVANRHSNTVSIIDENSSYG
jgi:DNA-binding beta-propeller fold protein YncE